MSRASPDIQRGQAETRKARRALRGALIAAAVFSVFVNLLMLTGPLFMLQVYDRVLPSSSEATLLALFGLIVFLFLMMAVLDLARTRVMSRVAARLQASLQARVFDAGLRRAALIPGDAAANQSLRDLDAVQRAIGSGTVMAVFDLPWVPIFMAAVFVFHPWLGVLALAGGALLIGFTVLNQITTRHPVSAATAAQVQAERMSDNLRNEAEMIQALGMRRASFARWQTARDEATSQAVAAADANGMFSIATKTFRLFLQSAMLALGAWLVLRGELTAGAMVASSILMGRALSPVEQLVGGWSVIQRAQEGWHRTILLLGSVPQQLERTPLPRPQARLEATGLAVVPPGQNAASLRGVSFKLAPGQAMGVIGPSGAGKTTLARAITGLWRPAQGAIRLDGATLDQYDPDVLGRLIGFLPQRVTLFDGTIAENIARMDLQPDAAKVVEAARQAAAHQLILDLPLGYDTPVSQAGGRLSGGQIQRIGLARALYGDPVILVLDEPNANLDNDGSVALNTAIRNMKAAGRSVLIMAHRPAAIQECELLMVLENGQPRAYGPRDDVLRSMVRNAGDIVRSMGPTGQGGGLT
ncbi:type I secretion system permease/ATPase [Paracoccus sp. p3-h83]|uniref:type I secretion system permease/ATPase n=1 Tax=Paracoccus sp. p3-h83 TaxID=3342805 RepID=UPI0035B8D84F